MEQEMDVQLWEYIDGICNETDAERIALLIKENAAWAEKYAELIAFNSEIVGSIELEQPSLRFTKNVMEAVAATHIAPAAKKYINPIIIRGIAAFFVVMILSTLVYAFATASYGSNSSSFFSELSLSKLDLSGIYSSAFLKVFMMVNIVLGLVLADGVLRKEKKRMPA